MSDMSLLPVGSGMGSDALAAAGGAFVGGLLGNWFGNGFGGNGWQVKFMAVVDGVAAVSVNARSMGN